MFSHNRRQIKKISIRSPHFKYYEIIEYLQYIFKLKTGLKKNIYKNCI